MGVLLANVQAEWPAWSTRLVSTLIAESPLNDAVMTKEVTPLKTAPPIIITSPKRDSVAIEEPIADIESTQADEESSSAIPSPNILSDPLSDRIGTVYIRRSLSTVERKGSLPLSRVKSFSGFELRRTAGVSKVNPASDTYRMICDRFASSLPPADLSFADVSSSIPSQLEKLNEKCSAIENKADAIKFSIQKSAGDCLKLMYSLNTLEDRMHEFHKGWNELEKRISRAEWNN